MVENGEVILYLLITYLFITRCNIGIRKGKKRLLP